MMTIYSALVLFASVVVGTSLQCYNCIETSPGTCAAGVESSMTKEVCETTYHGVISLCFSVNRNVNGANVYERGCGYYWDDGDFCSLVQNQVSCIACQRDFCN